VLKVATFGLDACDRRALNKERQRRRRKTKRRQNEKPDSM